MAEGEKIGMNKKKNPAVQIWYVAYPFLFYYAVSVIVMSLCTIILGDDTSHFVARQLFTTVVTIPFMMPFYKQDRALLGREGVCDWFAKDRVCHALSAIVIVACVSIALNNLISMTPLVDVSAGYQEANANFYGSTLVLELISSAFMTPILEELVFRGILFTRLKSMLPKIPAIVVSALIFAIVHFNMVQFIYAFLLGIVLALLMDLADHVYPAIIGHVTANLIAVLRTETGILTATMDKSIFAWMVSVVLLLIGLALLVIMVRKAYDKDRITN